MISIVILGAGNVATHFYKAFKKCDNFEVIQWYNRSIDTIESYKNEVSITTEIETLVEADLYLIAISDDDIAEVSKQLPFENRLIAHTSGSVNIHDMDKKNHRAVFYPLQTFSKPRDINFSDVPLCVEILDKSHLQIFKTIAEELGSPFYKINSDQRRALHLSAVFVNNFANQLYRVAHEISDSQSVNFEILKPLILETAKKINELSPYQAQTGPAKRNDKKTIKKHLNLLESEQHKQIYKLLTEAIKQTHGVM